MTQLVLSGLLSFLDGYFPAPLPQSVLVEVEAGYQQIVPLEGEPLQPHSSMESLQQLQPLLSPLDLADCHPHLSAFVSR
jgi:hypothetical protein